MPQNPDTQLLVSFADFIQDAKPYHTKLREFVSELEFNDEMTVQLIDEKTLRLYYQGAWGRDSVGGTDYFRVMSGTDDDLSFRIPATVFPRFSLNDSLNYGQTPHGYDPATHDLTDVDNNGVPDVEEPWTGGFTYSHQEGVTDEVQAEIAITMVDLNITGVNYSSGTFTYSYDIVLTLDRIEETIFGFSTPRITVNEVEHTGSVTDGGSTYTLHGYSGNFTPTVGDLANLPDLVTANYLIFAFYGIMKSAPRVKFYFTETGRYYTPFHQGAKVRVNGAPQQYGVHFLVDTSRSFIQFTLGNHPQSGDKIDINLMTADRLFITYQEPFTFGLYRTYDMSGLDMLPYDTDENDSPDVIRDYFTLTINDAQPDRYDPPVFFNALLDSHKGVMDDISIDPSALNGEVWTIAAVSYWVFTVQRTTPLSSTIEYAYFRQPFDNGKIAFTITSSWLEYYFSEDTNHYGAFDDDQLDYFAFAIPNDDTDFLVNLNLKTEHGVVSDPEPNNHAPVVINDPILSQPLAVVKQVLENTDIGPQPSYRLEFLNAPPQGTYIELRIEQFGQVNQRASLDVAEFFQISQVAIDASPVSSAVIVEYLTEKTYQIVEQDLNDSIPFLALPGGGTITVGRYPPEAITYAALFAFGLNNYGQLGIDQQLRGYSSVPNLFYPFEIEPPEAPFVPPGVFYLRALRTDPTPVSSTRNWNKLSAQGVVSAGIKDDGSIWAWGDIPTVSGFGSVPVSIGTGTWREVTVGEHHVSGIKTDGTLWTFFFGKHRYGSQGTGLDYLGWGSVSSSSPVQIGSGSDWASLARGKYAALATKTDGSLWAWGENFGGQLGLGNTVDLSSPVQVGALTDWSQVSTASSAHVMRDLSSNIPDKRWRTVAWSPELGIFCAIATAYPGYENNTYADDKAGVATSDDGVTWTLGSIYNSNYRQMIWSSSLGKFIAVARPVFIWPGPFQSYSGGVTTSSDGISWSAMVFDGRWETIVEGNGVFVIGGVNVNSDTRIAYSTDANTWTLTTLPWPDNAPSGIPKLAYNGNVIIAIVGIKVATSTDGINWTLKPDLSVGTEKIIAKSGMFLLPGKGTASRISLDDGQTWITDPSPVNETGGTGISAGTYDGHYFYWLQDNMRVDISTDGFNWERITGLEEIPYFGPPPSGNFYYASYYDMAWSPELRKLVMVGYAELEADTGPAIWYPLFIDGLFAASDGPAAHTVAVKTDGTLWSWGTNRFGQLGHGDRSFRSSPVQVGALSTWAKVQTGSLWTERAYESFSGSGDRDPDTYIDLPPKPVDTSSFTIAIKTDGTLWAWGDNTYGQLGLGDTIARSSPVQIGALTDWTENFRCGGKHVIAVKADGTLWGWGNNEVGQIDGNNLVSRSSPVQIGTGTSWRAQIAAGGKHTLVVTPPSPVTISVDTGSAMAITGEPGPNNQFGIGFNMSTGEMLITGEQVYTPGPNFTVPSGQVFIEGFRPTLDGVPDNSMWGVGLSNNGELGVE